MLHYRFLKKNQLLIKMCTFRRISGVKGLDIYELSPRSLSEVTK